jgi:hypothetical protein
VCTFPKIIEVEPLENSHKSDVKQINEVISFTQKKMIQTGNDAFDYGYVISNVVLNRDEAVSDNLMKSLTPNTNDAEIYSRGFCKLQTLNLTMLKKNKGIAKEFDYYYVNNYYVTADESLALTPEELSFLKELFSTPSESSAVAVSAEPVVEPAVEHLPTKVEPTQVQPTQGEPPAETVGGKLRKQTKKKNSKNKTIKSRRMRKKLTRQKSYKKKNIYKTLMHEIVFKK